MINSRSTPEEIKAEYKRLQIEIAIMDNQFNSFAMGGLIGESITELEDRYYYIKMYFREVEKRFSRLPLST